MSRVQLAVTEPPLDLGKFRAWDEEAGRLSLTDCIASTVDELKKRMEAQRPVTLIHLGESRQAIVRQIVVRRDAIGSMSCEVDFV